MARMDEGGNWRRDTEELVRTFIGLGFKAILACVDTKALDAAFARVAHSPGPTEDRYSASFSTMSRTSRGSTAFGPGSFVMNQVIV